MWSCNINNFRKIPNGFLGVSENVHRNRFDRLGFSMNHPTNSFCGLPAKNFLLTTLANRCGNLFDQNMFVVDVKDFVDKDFLGFGRATYVTAEQSYLRLEHNF